MTAEKFHEMADEMRKEGFNFVFVVERDGKVYSQTNVEWGSKLKELCREAYRVSRAGSYPFPGEEK